jgi:hypothetical protein
MKGSDAMSKIAYRVEEVVKQSMKNKEEKKKEVVLRRLNKLRERERV